ncbi:hypothetical protein [Cellulomonas sp. ES6]|uniref:hypothetical protein n=1 Tax=Cellulomonas sp. ES6 TaxID=3039384 RepID=UPI0024B84F07|nr:hypothetical protein [Cellulomonas sp. ES6]WHP16461.1 hypothetical protein P9841_12630 [Cellulomonas sp. ES6]
MNFDWWERVDCSGWDVLTDETQSSEDAVWLRDPNRIRWLYKAAGVQDDGRRDGEDWAELIATMVSAVLGVPCAEVRLCCGPRGEGSISRTVIPKRYDIREGLIWVPDQLGLEEYRPRRSGESVKRPGHSLEKIRDSLRGVSKPPGAEHLAGLDGYDTFAGYLCLDALIANRDRHEQNWAVLEPALAGDEPTMLAPSFDHGSGLGYNLTDDARRAKAADPGALERFAVKGTAHRFEHSKDTKPITLVAAAAHGLSLATPTAQAYWRDRVMELDLSDVCAAVMDAACDALSDPARTMATKLLDMNLRRLRDELDHRI